MVACKHSKREILNAVFYILKNIAGHSKLVEGNIIKMICGDGGFYPTTCPCHLFLDHVGF